MPIGAGIVPAPLRAFDVALSVADLDRAVAFYEVLFGTPPAKRWK